MPCFIWEQCAVSTVVWADECSGINIWASDSVGVFQSGEFLRRYLAAWQLNRWHGQKLGQREVRTVLGGTWFWPGDIVRYGYVSISVVDSGRGRRPVSVAAWEFECWE